MVVIYNQLSKGLFFYYLVTKVTFVSFSSVPITGDEDDVALFRTALHRHIYCYSGLRSVYCFLGSGIGWRQAVDLQSFQTDEHIHTGAGLKFPVIDSSIWIT